MPVAKTRLLSLLVSYLRLQYEQYRIERADYERLSGFVHALGTSEINRSTEDFITCDTMLTSLLARTQGNEVENLQAAHLRDMDPIRRANVAQTSTTSDLMHRYNACKREIAEKYTSAIANVE